jgi:hypothetical protein
MVWMAGADPGLRPGDQPRHLGVEIPAHEDVYHLVEGGRMGIQVPVVELQVAVVGREVARGVLVIVHRLGVELLRAELQAARDVHQADRCDLTLGHTQRAYGLTPANNSPEDRESGATLDVEVGECTPGRGVGHWRRRAVES